MTAKRSRGWNPPRLAVWILLLAWAGFWVWFSIASALGERQPDGHGHGVEHGHAAGGSLGHLIMAMVIVAVVVIAWRWERVGGILLVILSAVGLGLFRPGAGVALLLLVPPALVGLWLLTTAGSTAPGDGTRDESGGVGRDRAA